MPNMPTAYSIGVQATTALVTTTARTDWGPVIIKTVQAGPVVHSPTSVLTGNSSATVHASGFTTIHL
jgi:hypothetical protein